MFRAHHERGSFRDKIIINGVQERWERNRFRYTIKPGMNNLGAVAIPSDQFK